MPKRNDGPRLGKWWAYFKRRVLLLPQEPFAIEADFCPLPDIVDGEYGYWLGLVAHHQDGSILTHNINQEPPNLDSIARQLAGTMQCSYPRPQCRPKTVYFRDGPEWQAMVPYLTELQIEAIATEELPQWDQRAEEMISWLQTHWATWPMTQPRPKKLPIPEALFDLRRLSHMFRLFHEAPPVREQSP